MHSKKLHFNHTTKISRKKRPYKKCVKFSYFFAIKQKGLNVNKTLVNVLNLTKISWKKTFTLEVTHDEQALNPSHLSKTRHEKLWWNNRKSSMGSDSVTQNII